MKTSELTIAEKLILAAADLMKKGCFTFTAEDLAVTAWEGDREAFGLEGYKEKYPNFNTTASALAGDRGLHGRGWLLKTGKKKYQLSKSGRDRIALINGEQLGPVAEFTVLPKAEDQLFQGLFLSAAWQLFQGDKLRICFADANKFWGMSGETGTAVDARLDQLSNQLAGIGEKLADQDAQLTNGRLVTAGDVRVLQHLHGYLMNRFEPSLNLMRGKQ